MAASRRFETSACLVAVCALFVASIGAADDTAEIKGRISAVENNLIPAVRIKGRAPARLAERKKQVHVPGGNYSLGLFGEVKVESRKESIFVSLASGREFELFFESDTKFFTPDPGITGRVVRNGQGQVSELVVNVFGQEIHARKKKS